MAERSSFTSDGRLFVIGVRPEDLADARGSLVEVIRTDDGRRTTRTILEGTLEGTLDGRIDGAPAGDPCVFSGMTARGMRIYAGCVTQTNYRAALLEIDVAEGSVRAGYFTTCNADPSVSPCQPTRVYPNGMSIDSEGRLYTSDTFSHVMLNAETPTISLAGSGTIAQITLDHAASSTGVLRFTHRNWFSGDIFTDGLVPNGIQIEGSVLYYAAGPNINRVDIGPTGEAGAASVHYYGPVLSMIDDFAIVDGRMALARALPPAVVALERAEPFRTARELGRHDLGLSTIPSSISYQADLPAGHPVFPAESLIVTSFFGGGIYSLTIDR